MKGREPQQRRILHVDLDPFFVSVERSLDPTLRGRKLIVGAGPDATSGLVAAASSEARAQGIVAGQSLGAARRLCPDAAFRPGDLEAYAHFSQEVTTVLLAASRRVERPSADEAFVDLGPEALRGRGAVTAAEAIKDELQRRLGLDASLGLAGSRLAARVASRWARPRGLLVVLPGYEAALLSHEPIGVLPDLPAHIEDALRKARIETLGQLAAADVATLTPLVGAVAASRLKADLAAEHEQPIAVAAPPAWIQEERTLRTRNADRVALEALLDDLAAHALRRLRPFELAAGNVSVEVRRGDHVERRSQALEPGVQDEAEAQTIVRAVAAPLLDPPTGVRGVQLRFTRLARPGPQAPLFPGRVRLFG
jgi:DNA polymerase-4